jgi:GAF domain-containing protein
MARGIALWESILQQNSAARDSQGRAAPPFASTELVSGVRFPREDRGRSLAEMAQRDLDAALQLLADRAQYITGASGAAIALRRSGMADMLCRASTGSNAPELGALLSTEFGLSGESVRTKRPLRCDDAERDVRVNREACRELGIASVVVMPVVHDDEVLGVFELFSGKAHAFGDRDLSAIRRLSEMVETAVRMAQAAAELPQRLNASESAAPETAAHPIGSTVGSDEEQILEIEVVESQAARREEVSDAVVTSGASVNPTSAAEAPPPPAPVPAALISAAPSEAAKLVPEEVPPVVSPASTPVPAVAPAPTETSAISAPAKKIFWSASLDLAETTKPEAAKPAEADQAQVPPVLRGLRKCEACGFPVSTGRVLCVECEEKKWRGQLRKPQPGSAPVPVVPNTKAKPEEGTISSVSPVRVTGPRPASAAGTSPVANATTAGVSQKDLQPEFSGPTATASAGTALPPASRVNTGPAELVFSAAIDPPQSWIAAHKYVVAVLLAIAFLVAAVYLSR